MALDLFDKLGSTGIKVALGNGAGLGLVMALVGSLVDQPDALLPLATPLVWFFFGACSGAVAAGVAELAGYFQTLSKGLRESVAIISVLLIALSVVGFGMGAANSLTGFADMTGRLKYEEPSPAG